MLKGVLISIPFISVALLLPRIAFAQVVLNEFSSSTSPDWVELYAISETDISGWKIDDDATSTIMHTIQGQTVLGVGELYVADVSNRLNNPGDIISLYTKEDSLVDQISYGDKGGVCVPSESQSAGRVENGNTIERFATPTKEGTNVGAALAPCPTPTPEPTEAPTPASTKTPESTKTASPTPKPTVKATATSRPTTKPISEKEEADNEKLILGLREELENSPPPEEEVEEKRNFPFYSLLFILPGIGFIGYPVFSFLRKRQKGYTGESEEGFKGS